MSYATWANFVYYNTGNIVSYQTINYSALQANVNEVPTGLAPNWQVLPSPSGAGVSSLVAGTGALTMSLVNGGTVSLNGNDIELDIPAVASLNALTGAVLITSSDSSVGITPAGQEIDLSVVRVESLNALTGAVLITSTDSSVGITPAGQDIDLSVVRVESLTAGAGALTGALTLSSPDGSIGISSPDSSNINLVGTPPQYPILIPVPATTFSGTLDNTAPFDIIYNLTLPYTNWYGGNAVLTLYINAVSTTISNSGAPLFTMYCSMTAPQVATASTLNVCQPSLLVPTGINGVFILPFPSSLAAGSGNIEIVLRGEATTVHNFAIDFQASYATLSRSG